MESVTSKQGHQGALLGNVISEVICPGGGHSRQLEQRVQRPWGRSKHHVLGPRGLKSLKDPEGILGNEAGIGGDTMCGPQ